MDYYKTKMDSSSLHTLITDMELVLMEVTEHFKSKTDLSSITAHFFKS